MHKHVGILISGLAVGVVVVGFGFFVANSLLSRTSVSTQEETALTPTIEASQYLASEPPVNVVIKNRSFVPSVITIDKGTKITWVNTDRGDCNVVADADSQPGGLPDQSPLFGMGQIYEFTFNTVGTFPYHCTSQPDMHGTVEVIE